MTEFYDSLEPVYTSEQELRALFNAEILPLIESGQLFEHVKESTFPSPSSGQPPGAMSQTVVYRDTQRIVAEAHRFLLKDGSLGGSGQPDPKRLLLGGVLYIIDHHQ